MSMTVDVEQLRIGMFVHLDLGWWAHPFALSSFLITTPEQIETIRGLGLKSLRWSPDKSRLPVEPQADADTGVDGEPSTAALAAEPEAAPQVALVDALAAGAAVSPLAPMAARAGDLLSDQQEAQRLCVAQYNEAGSAWNEAQRLVPRQPEKAREITQALTKSLLDKMMVDREMCVRVLSEVGGDRVSGHALNVTVISLLMGRVFGFGAQEMQDLGMGSLLHDVGKLDLPEHIRHLESRLTGAEQVAYREHVALGIAQGQRMGLSEGAMVVLAQHHEMADGSGFPKGLNLDRMEIGARIVALVNRYDNLCNPPQASQALTPHEALSLLFAQSRNKFDSTMLNAFIRMMGVYPPGSLVQLTDDRYASVVSVNSSRPLKPRVLVCDTSIPVENALLLNLDGHADLGIRRSLKPTQLPAAARDYLSPRQRVVYFFEPVPPVVAESAEALAA